MELSENWKVVTVAGTWGPGEPCTWTFHYGFVKEFSLEKPSEDLSSEIKENLYIDIFKKILIYLLFRERGREGERERNIDV